ncbi:uncharacterized protein B0H18DRAFT_1121246 [Fomitopsis serialis]|uniref:uncharacterized protein n=1 Tax=Fomitopsis serialis TaxID=139415 RepID=UPI002007C202|nr:uncharacterized protein B0H18DRAFT_1121246 [Neoantrodia serialis]KAH9921788.1 hypothetical protein B0H18DRAFT_1121246 [Neoantrodia serialis]
MYKLIRRISSSFFPRPDRPWSEDATSSAPQIGRKRRLSSTEPDSEPSAKKQRSESVDDSQATREETPVRTGREAEEPEVKAVTKGVKEVELEDKPAASAATAAAVPLPDSPTLQPTQEAEEVKSESTESTEEKVEEPVVEATTTEQAPSASDDVAPVTVSTEPLAGDEKTSDADAEGEEIPGLSAVAEKGAESKADSAEKREATQPQPEADESTIDHP